MIPSCENHFGKITVWSLIFFLSCSLLALLYVLLWELVINENHQERSIQYLFWYNQVYYLLWVSKLHKNFLHYQGKNFSPLSSFLAILHGNLLLGTYNAMRPIRILRPDLCVASIIFLALLWNRFWTTHKQRRPIFAILWPPSLSLCRLFTK